MTVANFAVIDIQYFLDNDGEIIVKELAVVSEDNSNLKVFKNPFPWTMLTKKRRKSNFWTTTNHHGIHWNYGHIPYSELPIILASLCNNFEQLFTKGHEKREFLQRLLQRDVLDINEFIDPVDFKNERYESYFHCKHHHNIMSIKKCALKQALSYKSYIEENNHLFPVFFNN